MEKSIEPLVQDIYVENDDVIAAYNWYTMLDPDSKELIRHYKAEIDSDDWESYPLRISYKVANWLFIHKGLSTYRRFNLREPALIQDGVLKESDIVNIVENSKLLNDILYTSPTITRESIYLYRGEPCSRILTNYNKTTKQVTIYTLLSTSLNLTVAKSFTRGENCIMRFKIPRGNHLPFISDILSMGYRDGPNSSESEVLLPIGCVFQIENPRGTILQSDGVDYRVYDFTLVKFGNHQTRNFWADYKKLAITLYHSKMQGKSKRSESDSDSDSDSDADSESVSRKSRKHKVHDSVTRGGNKRKSKRKNKMTMKMKMKSKRKMKNKRKRKSKRISRQ
jgi:hypothetical protein